ncbi:MAG: hypothetical protein M1838_005170, partial [Thelocarpon superellum]
RLSGDDLGTPDDQGLLTPSRRSWRAQSDEHRSKRVKTEEKDAEGGEEELAESPDAQPALEEPVKGDDGPEAVPEAAPSPTFDIAALATQAAQEAIASMHAQEDGPTASHNGPITEGQPGPAAGEVDSNAPEPKPAPDVDFSSAPSDPTELALWVAQQISSFGEGGRGSAETDASQGQQPAPSHPPGIYGRRLDDDDDPTKAAERERIREENRERKKRWRESNTERNKDNDLRCRINKRAKTLWGPTRSVERSAWIEAEFNKRRAKRESKERHRSFDDDFPGFSFAPGIGSALFPAPGTGPQGETNAAGLLLANALLGVGGSGAGPNAEAAHALKDALEGGAVDPRPFTEALRAMAANPEIMEGINAILGGYSGNDDLSADDEAHGLAQSTDRQNAPLDHEGGNEAPPAEVDDEQSEIVKKLNQATAMLNELNESNEAQQRSNGFTAVNLSVPDDPKPVSDPAPSQGEENGHALDQAQIDALLALANGGALTIPDGPEDPALASLAENLSQQQDQANGAQADDDMSAILQRIIQQVMVRKDDGSMIEENNFTAPPTFLPEISRGPLPNYAPMPHSNSHSDPYGVARDPAMALSSLLHCAGMAINTVIPAAQSHATSQLYARLSSHSRTSTPTSGGIDPAHASAFGSTASMNRKLLARPNAYSRPLHTANTHPPRPSTLGPPPRPRNLDEERKARAFGFPPLPGAKIRIGRKT